MSGLSVVKAQQTEHLEIIFKKGPCDSVTDWGVPLSGGDVNGDGISDLAVGAARYLPPFEWRTEVYVFYGDAALDTLPDLIIYRPKHEYIGRTGLSACADVNGDGYNDIVISDPCEANGRGIVSIYLGGPGIDTVADLIIVGEGQLGNTLACSDVNGDGAADIIAGVYFWNLGDGRAYIYYGGRLLDPIPDVIINGHNYEEFGFCVGGGGDLNGDGYEDLVVGAPENDEVYPNGGKVYVFFGGNPMDTVPDLWHYGEASGEALGRYGNVITKYSFNSDQYAEGCWGSEFGQYPRGKAYVLYGGNPMDPDPDLVMSGPRATTELGYSVADAGRVVADSFSAVVFGGVGEDSSRGAAYLYLGGATPDTIPDGVIRGRWSGDAMGAWVAGVGDVNNDGKDEFAVSNYFRAPTCVWVCRYVGSKIEEEIEIRSKPQEARLRIYQNPTLSKNLRIQFAVSKTSKVKLSIYNSLGQVEEVLVDGQVNPGVYEKVVRKKLASGVHFVNLQVGEKVFTEKLVVVE